MPFGPVDEPDLRTSRTCGRAGAPRRGVVVGWGMPRRIDYSDRGDFVTGAVERLIMQRGLGALSMRAVAEECELAPSTILHQYTNRARLLQVTAVKTAAARLRWMDYRAWTDGALAFLPDTERQVELTRIWLAFVELGRSADDIGEIVEHWRGQEREVLARVAGSEIGEAALDALVAVVEGLVGAMFATRGPLEVGRARSALENFLDSAGIPRPVQPPQAGWA